MSYQSSRSSSMPPRSSYEEAYQRVDAEIRERMINEFASQSGRSGQSSYDEDIRQPQQPEETSYSSSPYHPYQPGQQLETIHTGETFQLPDNEYHGPENAYYDPYRASYSSHSSSNHSSHHTYVDSFQHDPEAYSSGTHLRTYPRSRSPTPAVDDEDYYVVGDNSFHYTGEPHSYSDPEKHALGQPDIHYDYYDPPPSHSFESMGDLAMGRSPDPTTPVETRHFGNAPMGRVARRHKKKRVMLVDGKYKVPIPIPPRMVLPRKGEPEMMGAEYTAVTCDPDDFEREGYFLRQVASGRRTELLIVITMYNEDEILFCRTLYGVMKNVQHLCTRKNSQTWGADAWKKVVVCIVADGRKKVHPRVLDCLTLLGVYQPGPMKNNVLEKPVTAHLFEYTTSFGLDPNLQFKYPDKGIVPTQIIFCMKEKNQKKINSHPLGLQRPNVCILLDVGTRPGNNSIYKLWKVFDTHSNVGGACGEISVYKGKNWSLLLNPLGSSSTDQLPLY
ncbi:hypothetical protein VNI00_011794 [Paramarasmius palmivorus]|uniref:Chitin synthase n=1 Tax=Paramarasmius palmivorus TaxID=297713 RepID=A0AAW0CA39_9AGAR